MSLADFNSLMRFRDNPANLQLKAVIDQVAIGFKFTNKPKAVDIFTAEFLPPSDERLVR